MALHAEKGAGMTDKQKREIYDKTKGHCHFCGDPVVFEKRGFPKGQDLTGYWELDHVIQKHKGGSKDAKNCLAACTKCNRLRWMRTGDELRDLLFLGLIATDEVNEPASATGRALVQLRNKRVAKNLSRGIAPLA